MTVHIRIEYNLPDLLPTDDEEIAAQYDVTASSRNYETMVARVARKLFGTDAEVEIVCHRNLTGYCRAPQVDGATDSDDAAWLFACICSATHDEDWIVRAKRDRSVKVRVTEGEHNGLVLRAEQDGVSLSQYIHSRLF